MEDLTGQIFGFLKVTGLNEEESKRYSEQEHHARYLWDCECIECGTKYIRETGTLRSLLKDGRQTCGCKKCDIWYANNITGELFGSLRVTGFNKEASKDSTLAKNTFWDCICEVCGYKTTLSKSWLQKIRSKGTCGCDECKHSLVGERYGKLVVTRALPGRKNGQRIWECLCDCGNIVQCTSSQLRKYKGKKSCGCLIGETNKINAAKRALWDGDSVNPEYARLYHIWNSMNRRCYNENAEDYYLYGERGITVCDEWHTNWFAFKNWALSHGYTDELSIDRINVNGNYEPDNCRWATNIEQANNTRVNKYLTYRGETDTLANWCRKLGLDYHRTKMRLNSCGYSVEDAFEKKKYELRT